MKILVTNFHPGDGGGHTTYITSLVRSVPRDFQMFVACPKTSMLFHKLDDLNPTVCLVDIEFPGKIRETRNIIRQFTKLRSLLLREHFDVIHVNGSPDHRLIMLLQMSLPSRLRSKIVFTKHNSYPLKTGFLTRYRFRHYCDRIICVCSGLDSLIPDNVKRCSEVVIIENGVDTNLFRPEPGEFRKAIRAELRIPENNLMLVSCAGTALHKGWQYLAEAARADKTLNIVLLGHEPKNETLDKLFECDTPENLVFTGVQTDVRSYLGAADIGFVLSTSVETASFACREMMSMGLPMIVSDFGFLTGNIDGAVGWVVKAGSLESLRDLLPKLKQADLKKMGVLSRQRAVSRFDLIPFVRQTYDVYASLGLIGSN